MNIIQLQDRLKGLPDNELVSYVEQPMGEVPIYLALGELQRRKEMRERYQANQPDKPSISEQLVAEAKPKPMAMGLGAMAPQRMMPGSEGVGVPQPKPAMDPRQMAASGIAANPVSNVGGPAMMAEGGIVGYAIGGPIPEDDFTLSPKQQFELENNPSAFSVFDDVATMAHSDEVRKAINEAAEKEIQGLQSGMATKKTEERLKNIVNKDIPKGDDTDDGTGDNTLTTNVNTNNNTGGGGFITPVDNLTMEEIFGDFRKTPEQRREEYRELQALYGMDPDYFKDARKKSIDLGLIEAGLRIAGGTSANPFENISKGATPALQAFAKEQSRLSGAQRLENMAAMKAYQDSVATDKALAVELYKAKKTAEAAGATSQSNIAIAAQKATAQKMKDIYGNLQGGVYFSTPEGRKVLDDISNAFYKKYFTQFSNPGSVVDGPDVYIPFKDKKFTLKEIETITNLDKEFEELVKKNKE